MPRPFTKNTALNSSIGLEVFDIGCRIKCLQFPGFQCFGRRIVGVRIGISLTFGLWRQVECCALCSMGLFRWLECSQYSIYQDPPCTLKLGYMVPNSGYLGPNRGQKEGLGSMGSIMNSYQRGTIISTIDHRTV